jgi:hypothetical protein
MTMKKIRTTLLAGAICWALIPVTGAANEPQAADSVRPTPVEKSNAAMIAAARAAAQVRATPAVVAVDLPVLSVQQIVDHNITARGGLQAWQRVNSMTLAGKLDAGKARADGGQLAVVSKQERARAKAEIRKAVQEGKPVAQTQAVIQLPFQMDLKRPTLTRLEIPFQGATAVQVFDGSNGWKLRPFLGRHEVEAFTQDELKSASSQQELDGPLFNYAAKGTRVELLGGELVEGRGAYKLKLTLKSGELRHVWIDAKTFLDLKMEGAPRRLDGKTYAVVTYFRNYKAVDGLQIAHQLDTAVEGLPGAGMQRILIDKVALNPPLDSARFSKPM